MPTRTASRNAFVLTACGDEHAARVDLALRFLRAFTRNDIVVIHDRNARPIAHDQLIRYPTPRELGARQASRFLKTGIHRALGRIDRRFCYIDNDVFAVSERAGEVFAEKRGPIAFATDHAATPATFGRHALVATPGERPDLPRAIARKFGVSVDPGWPLLNGGVFVFDDESTEILDTWHEWTLNVLRDERWADRDQGTLTATIWRHGLQNAPRIAPAFNWLVRHTGGCGSRLEFDRARFAFRGDPVHMLHFIEGHGSGYGADCDEWGDAMSLLARQVDRR